MDSYYFCTAGTKEKPCDFKCESSRQCHAHMEFEHDNIVWKIPLRRELTPKEKEIESKRHQKIMQTRGEIILDLVEYLCDR